MTLSCAVDDELEHGPGGACGEPDNGSLSSTEHALLTSCSYNAVDELPVSHWNAAARAFSPDANDSAAMSPTLQGSCFYAFGTPSPDNPLPTFESYNTDNYSRRSGSAAEASATVTRLCEASPHRIPFRMINGNGDVLGKLQGNSGRVQVIANVIIDNSLATIFLPPQWAPGPEGRYPILFEGYYDTNDNLLVPSGSSTLIGRLVAESGLPNRSGAIGVIWNGGSGLSSASVSPSARRQFANVIDAISVYLGGKRNDIVMFGGSRGGTTTLTMASNPDNYNYTVKFAFAQVPGVKIGTHIRMIGTAMPAQLVGLTSIGFANAWQPGWVYPSACGGPSFLANYPAGPVFGYQLTGGATYQDIDDNRSPNSAAWLARLQQEGTQVVLQFGSHDQWIPFGTELEYLDRLRQYGVPTEAHILMRGGHAGLADMLTSKVEAALVALMTGGQPTVQAGLTQYYTITATGRVPLSVPANRPPFTVEVPKRMYSGMDLQIVASGRPGTNFWVEVAGITFWGTVGVTNGNGVAQGPNSTLITVPTTGVAGTFAYTSVRAQYPGEALRYIPLTNTPPLGGEALSTTILPGPIPNIDGDTAWRTVWMNTNGAGTGWYTMTSWGVSEF